MLVSQLHGGGAEKVIANLSVHLSDYYNIIIVVYNAIDKSDYPSSGELIKLKLPFDTDTSNNSFFKRLTRFIFLIKEVRKIKKRRNISASISFLEASNFVNILSSRREKLIIGVRSYLSHEFKDIPRLKIFKPLIRRLYNKADAIVVPSIVVKNDLQKNFNVSGKNSRVIYNFIDQKIIEALKVASIPNHHENIFRNHQVIINVGRLSNPKAQWLQLPLLKKVKSKFPSARLVILGDGPLTEKVLQVAEKEELKVYVEGITPPDQLYACDVFLLGQTKNPFPYLKRSTIFIMSSVYEGFPNVVIEAMASGLPVVSSDCLSGPREILSPSSNAFTRTDKVEFVEYGILTPVSEQNNEDKFVLAAYEGVSDLLSDNRRMLHYKQQSMYRSNDYQRENIIKQWVDLIG